MQRQLINSYDTIRSIIVNVFRRLIFKKLPGTNLPSKILVVRKGTIGDHVVCQPIYLALKVHFKDAQIDLLTANGGNKYAHIDNLPESKIFHHCFNFDDFEVKELHNILRKQHYNWVIELPQDLDTLYTQIRNMFFYRSCGIQYGVGWSIGNSYFFKNYRYLNMPNLRQLEKHKQGLKQQGLQIPITDNYLGIDESLANLVKTKFPEIPQKYLVIAPGAKFSAKTWDIEKYKSLAEKLIKQGNSIVIVGSEKEGEGWSNGVINLAGKTTLEETKVILKNAQLLVCNDSGPMHLAYSLGTPLVALFGTRNYPNNWMPPSSDKFIVLHHPNPTNSLAFIEYEYTSKAIKHCKNLESISVEDVLEKCGLLLIK